MASATIDIQATVQDTATVGLGSYSGNPKITSSTSLTGITKTYSASRNISTANTLDVNSGLTDAYGHALAYTTVKAVVIANTHATATLTIGGGSNPLFGTDQYTLKAGAILPILSNFTVDGTHKVITVTLSAAATYQVLILGT